MIDIVKKKKDNVQIACLHLYPFKDQHAAEKDLQLISIFLTGTFCNKSKTNMLQKKISNSIVLINRINLQGSNTEC